MNEGPRERKGGTETVQIQLTSRFLCVFLFFFLRTTCVFSRKDSAAADVLILPCVGSRQASLFFRVHVAFSTLQKRPSGRQDVLQPSLCLHLSLPSAASSFLSLTTSFSRPPASFQPERHPTVSPSGHRLA